MIIKAILFFGLLYTVKEFLFEPVSMFLELERGNNTLSIALFIGITIVLSILISLVIRLLIKLNEIADKVRVKIFLVIKPLVIAVTALSVVTFISMYYLGYIVSWVEMYILLKPYTSYIVSVYALLLFLYLIGECPKCTSVHFSTLSTGSEDETIEFGTREVGDESNKTFVATSRETTTYGIADRACSTCGHNYRKRWERFTHKHKASSF